jgi:hypothetical protein
MAQIEDEIYNGFASKARKQGKTKTNLFRARTQLKLQT